MLRPQLAPLVPRRSAAAGCGHRSHLTCGRGLVRYSIAAGASASASASVSVAARASLFVGALSRPTNLMDLTDAAALDPNFVHVRLVLLALLLSSFAICVCLSLLLLRRATLWAREMQADGKSALDNGLAVDRCGIEQPDRHAGAGLLELRHCEPGASVVQMLACGAPAVPFVRVA